MLTEEEHKSFARMIRYKDGIPERGVNSPAEMMGAELVYSDALEDDGRYPLVVDLIRHGNVPPHNPHPFGLCQWYGWVGRVGPQLCLRVSRGMVFVFASIVRDCHVRRWFKLRPEEAIEKVVPPATTGEDWWEYGEICGKIRCIVNGKASWNQWKTLEEKCGTVELTDEFVADVVYRRRVSPSSELSVYCLNVWMEELDKLPKK